MKRFALLLTLLPSLLLAQSVPNGGTITQGQVWTTEQWTAAWQAKVDTIGGILTSPNVLGHEDLGSLSTPSTTPLLLHASGNSGGDASIAANGGTGSLDGTLVAVASGGATLNGGPFVNYPQTAAESAASVTPVNYYVEPCNINRYGINTSPGITDMSGALANEMLACTSVYIPAGSYLAGVTVPNTYHMVIYGDGPSSILVQKSSGSVFSWSTSSIVAPWETIKDLGFDGTNGTAPTIATAGVGALTLQSLFFNNVPTGSDSIFVNGAAGTYEHDTRLLGIQIYSFQAGNAGVEFGPLASDTQIDHLIMSGGPTSPFLVTYCVEFDNGATTIQMSNSHPYNCATHIIYGAGSNNSLLFADDTFDNASGGDLFSISGSTGISVTGSFFEATNAGKNAVTLANDTAVSLVNNQFNSVSGGGYAVSETGSTDYTYVTAGSVGTTANWTAGVNNIIGTHSQVCSLTGAANIGCNGLGTYTVSSLPTCNAGRKYETAVVTDASSPTYNGTLTGGSSTKIPVFCNGSAWVAH
jgi:hypothetical protein